MRTFGKKSRGKCIDDQALTARCPKDGQAETGRSRYEKVGKVRAQVGGM